MGMVMYLISLLLFFVAAKLSPKPYPLLHARYVRPFAGAGIILAKKVQGKTDPMLVVLYGNRRIQDLALLHRAGKVVSFFLFAGLPVAFASVPDSTPVDMLLACLVWMAGTRLPDLDLWVKGKKRFRAIMEDYPSFAMEFALLLNAGLTPIKSWQMAGERHRETEFYIEARKVCARCRTGSSFGESLREFSLYLGVPEINTFISVILQGMQHGGTEMTGLLKQHALQCWEKRKIDYRKKAEEAGAKLVFPLMLGLLGILILLVYPAVSLIKQL